MVRMARRTRLAPVAMLLILGCGDRGERFHGASEPDTVATPASRDLPRRGLNPAKPLSQFTLSSWSSRDGLPQNSAQVVHQSADGYIWVGTQEGLVRFNGREFRVFDRSTAPGFLNNHITSVVEADSNRLWVGTSGGGVVCLSTTGTACGTLEGLSSRTIASLARDRRGGLWVGTDQDGLNYAFGDSIVTYSTVEGLPANRVSALLIDRSEIVWVGTSGGLGRIADGVVSGSPVAALSQTGITALVEDAEGAVWVGTTGGLYRILGDESRRFSRTDGLLSDWVLSLYADATGNVLIGTTNGVSRYRPDGLDSYQFSGGRALNLITALLVDHEGSLWVGTMTTGLHQLREAAITTYTTVHGLTGDIAYAVAGSSDGGVWIGLYTGEVDYYQNGAFRGVVSASELGSGRLRALHEDGLGRLWIGTEIGLHVYAAGRVRTFTSQDGLPRVSVRAISEERDGTILVGTDGAGLYRVQNDRLVPVVGDPPLPSGAIRTMHVDRNGELWVGTNGGLSVLREGGFQTYSTEDGLAHDQVRVIHESADGTLWIGTYGGGLSRFSEGSFINYTTREGLHSDAMYQILEDEHGDLWMSSNTGIFRVSRADLDGFAAGTQDRIESVVFDESDGMVMRECNGGFPGGYRSPDDGRLWFPTIAGVAVVDPRARSTRPPPPVVIERFSVDNEELPLGQKHVLSPGAQRLAFAFTALSFVAPGKTRFRYRLGGFDQAWVDAGGERLVQYTRLRPGDYTFNVEASIVEGVWTGQEVGVEFTLRPAFYQASWFIAACVLSIAALLSAGYRRRVYAIQKTERALRKRVDEAIDRITVLQGLLPICSFCKKIRDDTGYWNQIEVYIGKHSQAEFSHSLCPECVREHYPDFADEP